MSDVFSVTLPIFIILAIGYLSVYYHVIANEHIKGIGILVMRVVLPSLIFYAVSSRSISEILSPQYLIGYAIGSLLTFIIGILIFRIIRKQQLTLASLNSLGVSFSNTGYIGYPLLVTLIGTPAAIYLAMNMLIENILILPLFLILAETGSANNNSILKTLLKSFINMLKNPLIIALLSGLLVSIGNIKIPITIMKVVEMFALAAAPIGLFVCGASLYGLKLRGNMLDISLIAIGKLLIHPLLVFIAFYIFIPNVSNDIIFYAIFLAAAPMGSLFPLLGQRYDFEERCAATLLLTTIASFFTISLLLLLNKYNLFIS